MSKPTPSRPTTSRHVSATSHPGVSVWTATTIIIAALITGLLLSWNAHEVGWPFLACFIVAALTMTLLVEIRGLFLAVAQLPILFGIFIVGTSWLVASTNITGGSDSASKTMVLSAIYPLAQYFPQLAATTIGCALIAVLRHRRSLVRAKLTRRRFEAQRAREAKADQRNRATTSRIREMSARTRRSRAAADGPRITVDELVRDAEKRRIHGARGRAVPPRREPGESVKRMPPISEVARERRRPVPPREPRVKRPSLDDDLYS